MSSLLKKVTIILLILVLVATFGFGCGKKGEERTTITIGCMADLTGVASSAIKPIAEVFVDTARYYNDQDLIPGVKINAIVYDTHFDAARIVPGYDWLRGKGAEIIVVVMAQDAEMLKSFAERNKCVIVSSSGSPGLVEPPGWVFLTSTFSRYPTFALLKWISEHDWDYSNGIPKLGIASWPTLTDLDKVDAMKAYAQAHPDKFEFVDGLLLPTGTMDFQSAVRKLKDCDYISSQSPQGAYFWRDYLAAGYHKAKVLDPDGSMSSALPFFTAMNGWGPLDGAVWGMSCLSWADRDKSPLVQRMYDMLLRYRTGGKDISNYADNQAYEGAGASFVAVPFDILDRAVNEVGAQNFNGQAYYDAAIKYKTDGPIWENYPVNGYSETKRTLMDYTALWRINAAEESFKWAGEWLPIMLAP